MHGTGLLLCNWNTRTTIGRSLRRRAEREGFNSPPLSRRAWHSAERSSFSESIRGKLKLVPSAPSLLASHHKADDYQLEPARLQRSISSLANISTVRIWKLLTSCRLPVFHLFMQCTPPSHHHHRHNPKAPRNTTCNYTLRNTQNAAFYTVSREHIFAAWLVLTMHILIADISSFIISSFWELLAMLFVPRRMFSSNRG